MLELSLQSLAGYYGISEKEASSTINCESGFNPSAFNHSDPYGGSKGIAQFLQGTFDNYSSQLGIENADIWDPYQQLEVMSYMWSLKQEKQWSCYKKLYPNQSPP